MTTFITIILYAGIVQGFYMAFLLHRNKKQNAANNYLIALLITMSASIAHSSFAVPEVHKALNVPFRINEPFLMLVIPLMWLYVTKMERPQLRFRARTMLHFLPFVVFMSVNVPAFVHGSASGAGQFLLHNARWFYGVIWSGLLLQYSVYVYQIVGSSRRLKMAAKQELSNTERVDVSWINLFLAAFLVVFVIIGVMFAGTMHNFGAPWLNTLASFVFALSVFVLGYKGLYQQSIAAARAEFAEQQQPETESFEAVQAEASKPKTVDASLSAHLLQYMDMHKPQRDAELTLTSLAAQVGMSRNQLSEVINSGLDSNFYDFVNKYRTEDVKQLMNDPKCKDFTILAIAFEAGFPSKSTFNTVFKKQTGLTPSEYRAGLS